MVRDFSGEETSYIAEELLNDIEGSAAVILSRADLHGEEVSELFTMSREGKRVALSKNIQLGFPFPLALVPPRLSLARDLTLPRGLSSDCCSRPPSSSRKDFALGATFLPLRRNCAL